MTSSVFTIDLRIYKYRETGSLCVSFNVPCIYYGFYFPRFNFGTDALIKEENKAHREKVINRFLDLMKEELLAAWPEEKDDP